MCAMLQHEQALLPADTRLPPGLQMGGLTVELRPDAEFSLEAFGAHTVRMYQTTGLCTMPLEELSALLPPALPAKQELIQSARKQLDASTDTDTALWNQMCVAENPKCVVVCGAYGRPSSFKVCSEIAAS